MCIDKLQKIRYRKCIHHYDIPTWQRCQYAIEKGVRYFCREEEMQKQHTCGWALPDRCIDCQLKYDAEKAREKKKGGHKRGGGRGGYTYAGH